MAKPSVKSVPTTKNAGKKVAKSATKPAVETAPSETEKKRKTKDSSVIKFHSVIFKVFKETRGETQIKISKDTVNVLNTIVHDLVERIGEEAGKLCKYTKHDTMKVRDLATAIRLVINTQELTSCMCKGGDEAVRRHALWVQQHSGNTSEKERSEEDEDAESDV
eukprot:Protomagalhaensia_wolfi_Nauph_80__1395@NODE_1837_length_1314_cov_1508_734118_g1437_i0_p1_GENE_NODE_1837_length_1314_cov_1508_734118_g1437_i0NODE_1837_length_1314_cov_1508_734118_g1437_i0_p1_ORF_typecomplete_len177_score43_91Histone/PF00125_24/4_7e14TFIID18kDa/PF02269_16/3_8e03TFIID18kDa/PF02269_16/0_00045CBFD_NFYB_HMF/PF00808_23/8_7e03CBFD_NFYB_HMF/PF00808_23/0_0013TFIID_20kDa/PF03847_13/0_004CENPT_C/PF15511_6/0_0071DUF3408/PF11888_8/0_0079DUF3408/PF11888_8/1_5e03CENPS/PF15630_6/0_02_NODE_1837_l